MGRGKNKVETAGLGVSPLLWSSGFGSAGPGFMLRRVEVGRWVE